MNSKDSKIATMKRKQRGLEWAMRNLTTPEQQLWKRWMSMIGHRCDYVNNTFSGESRDHLSELKVREKYKIRLER